MTQPGTSQALSDPRWHDHAVVVQTHEIDVLNHVNNIFYLRWVQEATVAHWTLTAPCDAVNRYCWVAVRHEITYRRPAMFGDALIARVELQRVQRESAFYATEIRRGPEILAEIQSRWCCMDSATMQPARLPADVIACFLG